MKMKKVIAGVLASVVAVSAMATMAVSAAQVNQEAETKTFDLSDRGWVVEYETYGEIASKEGLTINADDYRFESAVTIEVTGKAADVDYQIVKKYASRNIDYDKDGEIEDNEKNIIRFVAEGDIAGKNDVALGLFDTITSIKFFGETKSENFTSKKAANEAAKKNWTTTLAILDGKYIDEYNNVAIECDGGEVKKADAEGIEFDFYKVPGISFNSKIDNLGYSIATMVGNKKGATISLVFKAPEADDDETVDNGIFGPGLEYEGIEEAITDLAMAPAITTKYTVWDPAADDGKGDYVTKYSSNFNGRVQAGAEIEENVAKFQWDEVVNQSGMTINSLALCNDIVVGHKDGAKLTLEKVIVEIPAKTVEDITLGEGYEEETAAPIVTDEAPVDTSATEAAPNPGTGNAPIALAVIPVAIVAAAIVAKKRG